MIIIGRNLYIRGVVKPKKNKTMAESDLKLPFLARMANKTTLVVDFGTRKNGISGLIMTKSSSVTFEICNENEAEFVFHLENTGEGELSSKKSLEISVGLSVYPFSVLDSGSYYVKPILSWDGL